MGSSEVGPAPGGLGGSAGVSSDSLLVTLTPGLSQGVPVGSAPQGLAQVAKWVA